MKKTKLLSLGTAVGLSAFVIANANANPFQAEMLQTGYDNNGFQLTKTAGGDGSCGAGNCGDDMKDKAKDRDGKCGEGKCGADKKAKDKDGKCGEGKCGTDKKAKDKDGKCGEGKCGGEEKGKDGKCGAGKCGADKAKETTTKK